MLGIIRLYTHINALVRQGGRKVIGLGWVWVPRESVLVVAVVRIASSGMTALHGTVFVPILFYFVLGGVGGEWWLAFIPRGRAKQLMAASFSRSVVRCFEPPGICVQETIACAFVFCRHLFLRYVCVFAHSLMSMPCVCPLASRPEAP